MKVKMLIAMAVSSMLAATLSYADPVAADDGGITGDIQSSQQSADNAIGGEMSGTGMSGASTAASGTGTMSGTSNSVSGTGTPGMSGTSSPTNGNDDMSADTATGDDDY